MPESTPEISDIAMWHVLSGQPDNVTDEGIIVRREPGRQIGSEKKALRAAITRLRDPGVPEEAQNLARLAAGYLLAGDVETARRYVADGERITVAAGASLRSY